VIDQHG